MGYKDPNDIRRAVEGSMFFILFICMIPLANYLISHIGTKCIPNGPCLIPVFPFTDLMAPSGVLAAGASFILRDLVQRRLGRTMAFSSIVAGTCLSLFLAPPALALASAAAFLISETLDFFVYTPLHKKRFILAVILSSFVGLIADSIAFLYFAFGSLDYLMGQVVGKSWMIVIAVPILMWLRQRDDRLGMGAISDVGK